MILICTTCSSFRATSALSWHLEGQFKVPLTKPLRLRRQWCEVADLLVGEVQQQEGLLVSFASRAGAVPGFMQCRCGGPLARHGSLIG
jgi:hypothetical protein